MTLAPPLSPSDRFFALLHGLRRVLAWRGEAGLVPDSFVAVLVARLFGLAERFRALAARGPGAPRARARARASGQAHRARRARFVAVRPDGGYAAVPGWMTRRRGWLVALAPEAADCADELRALLADPEVAALAWASPAAARTLRSACWMLAVPAAGLLPPVPHPLYPRKTKKPRARAWEPPRQADDPPAPPRAYEGPPRDSG